MPGRRNLLAPMRRTTAFSSLRGQSMLEAVVMIGLIAIALLFSYSHIRNGVAWMWKSASDQMGNKVPYQPGGIGGSPAI